MCYYETIGWLYIHHKTTLEIYQKHNLKYIRSLHLDTTELNHNLGSDISTTCWLKLIIVGDIVKIVYDFYINAINDHDGCAEQIQSRNGKHLYEGDIETAWSIMDEIGFSYNKNE